MPRGTSSSTLMYTYIHDIHPELKIGNFRFDSEKGAGPLGRDTGEALGEHEGMSLFE